MSPFWIWPVVALAGIAILALLTWAHLHHWTRRLAVSLGYAVEDRLLTADGSAIELRRLAVPENVAPRDGMPPVLLVHGMASSHRNLDAWQEASLARTLAARGRDVWLLTLRSGLRDWHHRASARVTFEAMMEHDLDAALNAIRERTQHSAVDYVGFSMGGMLLYAAMGRPEFRARVRRVATVGSPGSLLPRLPLWKVVRLLPLWLVPRLPLRLGARLIAFAIDWLHTPFHSIVCNPRNFAEGAMARALVNCIEDVPRSLMRQLAGWSFGDGTFRVGGRAVLDSLADVGSPALFLAGSVDRLAPVFTVKAAFEAWGGARDDVEKQLVLVGRAYGQSDEYGHGDLVVGLRAADEVFTRVADFLDGFVVPAPGGDAGPTTTSPT